MARAPPQPAEVAATAHPASPVNPRPCLTLYARVGCHLCEDMAAALDALRDELGFDYRTVDVDTDPTLVARYGRLVPVLALEEEVLCHYFLEPAALRARLARSE
ncbi:glutaredoxin family protein [Thiobacter aerophilum]|uniref:Glutaredoxin family protein n=1 Tax=Thiobacter aerophilum TaxID=3121275 RepID=A0ABV0EAI1_9BURK